MKLIVGVIVGCLTLLAVVFGSATSAVGAVCAPTDPFCFDTSASTATDLIKDVKLPEIAVPYWMGSDS